MVGEATWVEGSKQPEVDGGGPPAPCSALATVNKQKGGEGGDSKKALGGGRKRMSDCFVKHEAKRMKLEEVKKALEDGEYKSLHDAAVSNNLPKTTLYDFIKAPADKPFKPGRGRVSKVFSLKQEVELVEFVQNRADLGCGLDFDQLQVVIQEVLLKLKSLNPSKMTGFEATGQLPEKTYVYRLVKRHKIVLRWVIIYSKSRNATFPGEPWLCQEPVLWCHLVI